MPCLYGVGTKASGPETVWNSMDPVLTISTVMSVRAEVLGTQRVRHANAVQMQGCGHDVHIFRKIQGFLTWRLPCAEQEPCNAVTLY
jgi:hypothetical protein